MRLDHLAVLAADLRAGVAWTEARLGRRLRPGGRHDRFGTWNRLIRLGPGEYLEVIAPDPDAPAPEGPRWFGLSDPPAEPRLGVWVCAVPSLEAALRDLPEAGRALALTRGDLSWCISVPPDGTVPGRGGLPTLIQWTTPVHPAERLPDDGLALRSLEIRHPQAAGFAARLALDDPRLHFVPADRPGLVARIDTPGGEAVL